MLNLKLLPDEFKYALQGRGYSEKQMESLSPEAAFIEYCNWNCVNLKGETLWKAVQELKNSSSEA